MRQYVGTKVLEIKPQQGHPQHAPKNIRALGRGPNGPYLNSPEKGTIPPDRLAFLSAFNLDRGDKKPLVLLIFLKGKQAPYMVSAGRIAYDQFGLDPQASRPNFRKCITWLCKQCPKLAIDKHTYTFLKTGKLAVIPQSQLLPLATAIIGTLGKRASQPSPVQPVRKDPSQQDTDPLDNTLPGNTPPLDTPSETKPKAPKASSEDTLPARPAPNFSAMGKKQGGMRDTLPAQKIEVPKPQEPPSQDAFASAFPELEPVEPLPLPESLEEPGPIPRGAPTNPFAAAFPELSTPQPATPQPVGLDAFPELEDVTGSTPPLPNANAHTITCPKCGFVQPQADECAQCGIIIAKYKPREKPPEPEQDLAPQPLELADVPPTPTPTAQNAPNLEHLVYKEPNTDRFLSFDSAMRMTLNLLGDNIVSLVGLALIFLLMGIGAITVNIFIFRSSPIWIVFSTLFLQIATWTLTTIALTYHLHQVVEQGSGSIGETITQTFQRFPRAFVARIMASVLTFFGVFAGIIPGFIYAMRFYFVEAVCAVEDPSQQDIGATQISRNLVSGFELSVFATLVTFALIFIFMLYFPFYLVVLFLGPKSIMFADPSFLVMNTALAIMILLFWFLAIIVANLFVPTLTYVLYLELRTINQSRINNVSIGLEPMTRYVLIFSFILFIWWIIP